MFWMCAIYTFGHFVKFHVRKNEPSSLPAMSDPTKNAFQVMMANQRLLCQSRLPERVTEKNKNFNDLISLFDSKGLKWSDREESSGKSFYLPSRQFYGTSMDMRKLCLVVVV
jgi:hypothetical protein